MAPFSESNLVRSAMRQRREITALKGRVGRRMNTLGMATPLVPHELNQYFLEVFDGVIEAAARAGQTVTVVPLPDWHEGLYRLGAVRRDGMDGLILLAPRLDTEAAQYLPLQTPMIAIHANQALPGVTNLESSEEVGAFEAVRHMLALGHRRILHIGGPIDAIGSIRRREGFTRAHAAVDIKPLADHIVHGDYTTESGRRLMSEWLQRHRGNPLPHALFCASDAIATGCLEVLGVHQVRVPEDISIVGFDHTMQGRAAELATVRQPLHEMGERAVEMLVRLVDARHGGTDRSGTRNIVLPTEFRPGRTLSAPRTNPLLIA